MPDFFDAALPQTLGDAARIQAESAKPTFLEALDAAYQNTLPAYHVRQAMRSGYEPDPQWALNQSQLTSLSEGVDTDLIPKFGEAVSLEHAFYLQGELLDTTKRRRTLAGYGWKGSALNIVSSITDPEYLAVGLLTGGVGTAARGASTATRLAYMGRAGLATALPITALEEYRASQDPSVSQLDVLKAGLGALGLGAGGSLAAGGGRVGRAVAGGVGAAVLPAGVDLAEAAFSTDGPTSRDIWWSTGLQLALGATLSALHGTPPQERTPLARPMEAAGRRIMARAQAGDLEVAGATLTPKGEALMADALNLHANNARLNAILAAHKENIVATEAAAFEARSAAAGERLRLEAVAKDQARQANLAKINKAFDIATIRLADYAPDKRLNRTEVDAVLKGTGYTAANQGYPTPEELRFTFLRDLRTEALHHANELRAEPPPHIGDRVSWLEANGYAHFEGRTLADIRPDANGRLLGYLEGSQSGVPLHLLTADAVQPEAAKPVQQKAERVKPAAVPVPTAEAALMTKEQATAAGVEDHAAAIREAIVKGEEVAAANLPLIGMGAASSEVSPNPPTPKPKTHLDLDLSGVTDARPSMSAQLKLLGRTILSTRFDMPGLTGNSEAPTIRRATNALAKDPLPKADGSPSIYSASEWVVDRHAATMAELHSFNDAVYGEYVKSTGKGAMPRREFFEHVGLAVRRPRGAYTADELINRAADKHRDIAKAVHGYGERHMVKGFDSFDADDAYLTRMGDRPEIDRLTNDPAVGYANVLQVVAEAIKKKSEHLDDEMAVKLAKVWVKNIGTSNKGSDVFRGRMFRDSPEAVARTLREVVPDITDAQIEDILFAAAPRKPGENTITRARRRIAMDETHTIPLPNGETLGVEDLLINNSEDLMQLYARQVIGAAGLAETFRVLKSAPGEVLESVDQLIAKARTEAEGLGLKPHDYEGDLAKLEVYAKVVAGIPLNEDTATNRILRNIHNLNFIRTMSTPLAGMQNFSEIHGAMSELGASVTMKMLPEFGNVFARTADGQLERPLMRDLEILFGPGTDLLNHRVSERIARFGEEAAATKLHKAEQIIASAQRMSGIVSGQSHGTVIAQKWVAGGVAQRFYDIAASGKLPSAWRLAGAGLTEEMAARVNKMLVDPNVAKVETGAMGGAKITSFDLGNATDVEAAMAFRNAVAKTTYRMSLRNNPTEYAKWMTTSAGKMISQLRVFGFTSWTNKLLFELGARDVAMVRGVIITSAMAGLYYVARTYVDSVGKPDRDKFLQGRLTPAKIGGAMFSRAAYSSLLPMAADTAAESLNSKPVFSYARSSGLGGGALLGNPTWDWVTAAYHVPGAMRSIFDSDYDFSQEDFRNLQGALWVPNAFGLKQGLERLAARLPKESQRQH